MFVVMRDVIKEEFGQVIGQENSVMIGDTWHDETAATSFGIPFIKASVIHQVQEEAFSGYQCIF